MSPKLRRERTSALDSHSNVCLLLLRTLKTLLPTIGDAPPSTRSKVLGMSAQQQSNSIPDSKLSRVSGDSGNQPSGVNGRASVPAPLGRGVTPSGGYVTSHLVPESIVIARSVLYRIRCAIWPASEYRTEGAGL